MTDFGRIDPNKYFFTIKKADLNSQNNKETEIKNDTEEAGPKVSFKSADEVLDYLGKSNADLALNSKKDKTVIQVSKYVNKEQAKRISFAANKCIEELLKFEEAIVNEFGIPKPAAEAIAVKAFESRHLS